MEYTCQPYQGLRTILIFPKDSLIRVVILKICICIGIEVMKITLSCSHKEIMKRQIFDKHKHPLLLASHWSNKMKSKKPLPTKCNPSTQIRFYRTNPSCRLTKITKSHNLIKICTHHFSRKNNMIRIKIKELI